MPSVPVATCRDCRTNVQFELRGPPVRLLGASACGTQEQLSRTPITGCRAPRPPLLPPPRQCMRACWQVIATPTGFTACTREGSTRAPAWYGMCRCNLPLRRVRLLPLHVSCPVYHVMPPWKHATVQETTSCGSFSTCGTCMPTHLCTLVFPLLGTPATRRGIHRRARTCMKLHVQDTQHAGHPRDVNVFPHGAPQTATVHVVHTCRCMSLRVCVRVTRLQHRAAMRGAHQLRRAAAAACR